MITSKAELELDIWLGLALILCVVRPADNFTGWGGPQPHMMGDSLPLLN